MTLPITSDVPAITATRRSTPHQLDTLIRIYGHMLMAREIDRLEQGFTARGEAWFQVSGSGHEAVAALAPHLGPQDWLHCHYRDKALMLARGVPPESFFLSLFCKQDSPSHGRQMSAHMAWRPGNVLSLCGPVGNNALQAVGIAAEVVQTPGAPVVLCALGDGTAQQGEVMEAIAEAAREALPVLFLVEDNRYAISTPTAGRTFWSLPDGPAESFHGVTIEHLPGHDAPRCHDAFGRCVAGMRADRRPRILVLHLERLCDHTNTDDQGRYRSREEIDAAHEQADPLLHMEVELLRSGVEARVLHALRQRTAQQAQAAAQSARAAADPVVAAALASPGAEGSAGASHLDAGPNRPTPANGGDKTSEGAAAIRYEDATTPVASRLDATPAACQVDCGAPRERMLTMLMALRATLRARLESDPRVSLHGEDIEDPKGDVFGITSGLSTLFPQRVRNAPLSEATIVGSAIGRALAGGRPVAFLQFADFLPLAFNQIAAELGSMDWRTGGAWRCPVIIMAPCGGFRPGLGPFHAQTFESLVAHLPGINVVMPSTAADAAGLLNAAFESERPTVFLYPKACLNERAQATSADVANQHAPLGIARVERAGCDLTVVSYGNGMERCRRAASDLAAAGCEVELIDLRSMAPWDKQTVVASVQRTRRLLVVHEDNRSCGMGAEIIATVSEQLAASLNGSSPVAFAARRVVRDDTYVPCHFGSQLATLPSYRRVLEAAADMTGFDCAWQAITHADDNDLPVVAIGSGPADESVLLTQWHVAPGDSVIEGQVVATVEATKACVDIESSCAGLVTALCANPGEQVTVGAPLLRLRTAAHATMPLAAESEFDLRPQLRRRTAAASPPPTDSADRAHATATAAHAVSPAARSSHTPTTGISEVGLSVPVAVSGSQVVTNRDLCQWFTTRNPDEIETVTGITQRQRAAPGEDGVTLGVLAARRALAAQELTIADIDLLICSTVTPIVASPSTACRILGVLGAAELPAFDVSAACSGYLYALQLAHDHLCLRPRDRVLVITADVLSPLLDPDDFTTCAVFGDAATATVLHGAAHCDAFRFRLRRPHVMAAGDAGEILRVPTAGTGRIHMDGQKVFTEAVRRMGAALTDLCAQQAVAPAALDWIVPHQANQRILNTLAKRLSIAPDKVVSNIAQLGNTSSSSIPYCLSQCHEQLHPGQSVGLVAFGAGFTYGAALLDSLAPIAG